MAGSTRELKHGSRLKIKKEPRRPVHHNSSAAALVGQHRAPPPVIIYTHAPRIIHTDARHFMALVQKLTGMSAAGSDDHSDDNAAAAAAAQAPTSAPTDAGSVLDDLDLGDGYNVGLLLDYSLSSSSSSSSPPDDVSTSSCLTYQEMPAAAAAAMPGGWIDRSFGYGNLENLF